jgi:hypothetical protein
MNRFENFIKDKAKDALQYSLSKELLLGYQFSDYHNTMWSSQGEDTTGDHE